MAAHPLSAIVKRRDRVLQVLDREFVSGVNADTLRPAMESLMVILPNTVRYDAVYRTLLAVAGPPPDDDLKRRLAWALSADLPSLKAGLTVWPAEIPIQPTTVTVQVRGAKRLPEFRQSNTGGFPILYRMRIMIGRGATCDFDAKLSSRFVQYLASRPDGLGFARPPRADKVATTRGHLYQHYEAIVGMFMRLDISLDETGKTKLENFRSAGSLLAYNRALTEMRWRSVFVCPFNYTHPCHGCPKGLESCPAATHQKDHVMKLCPNCMKDAEFDLFWEDGVCRRCAAAPRKRKEK